MRIGRWLFCGTASAIVVALAVEGCGSGKSTFPDNVCGSPPSCSSVTAPTPSQITECTTQLSDPACGTAYQAMKECQTYRAKCRTNGAFDSSATNTECAPEITAYGQCTATQPKDAGPDSCNRRTCAQLNANCGTISDGCGGTLSCGTCTNGQMCGGTTPNRCGCTCDPTWCGTVSICGTTMTCPTNCVSPQSCGGGGVANRCGCLPSGTTVPAFAASVTTNAFSVDGGTQVSWSSPTSARLSDNSFAIATMGPDTTTQYLVALTFGITIPAGAVIDGIVVNVERSTSVGLATVDQAVYLVKNTQILSAGDNKAVAGIWPSAETTATYGGASDKWGTTWAASDINAGFGVAFAARYSGQTGSEQARVDAISVTIHYSGATCL
jgi:hypothetical protein